MKLKLKYFAPLFGMFIFLKEYLSSTKTITATEITTVKSMLCYYIIMVFILGIIIKNLLP